jgi:DNA-binding transcriptional LysR family regulator|nr:LysR substrate-binding domain-containing protein [Rhizobium ruizarguesonis]
MPTKKRQLNPLERKSLRVESAVITRAVAGKTIQQIRIGTVYPATTGVLPAFLATIAHKYPDIRINILSGNTGDIIRSLESGQINLGFIRPVEHIGYLRFTDILSLLPCVAEMRQRPLTRKGKLYPLVVIRKRAWMASGFQGVATNVDRLFGRTDRDPKTMDERNF